MTEKTAERLRRAKRDAEAAIEALNGPRDAWIAEATAAAVAWTTEQAKMYVTNQTSVSETLGKEGVAGVRSRVEALAETVQASLPASLVSALERIYAARDAQHMPSRAVDTVTNSVFKETTTRPLAAILKDAGYSTTHSVFHNEPEWYHVGDPHRSEHSGPTVPGGKHPYIDAIKAVQAAHASVSQLESELAKENAADLWGD